MKIIICIILIFTTSNSNAQKVKIKDNVFIIDDSSYCKLVGKKSVINPDYSIAAMNGTELIYMNENPDKDYAEITFLTTGKKAKLPTEKTGMFNKNIFVKLLFNNGVIINNEISEAGKNKFLAKYADDIVDENMVTLTTNQYNLINRNTEEEITIIGKRVMQDGIVVGMIEIKNYTDDNANFMQKYSFVLPTNLIVAEIKVDEFNAEKNSFITLKDNKIHYLKTNKGSWMTQEDEALLFAVKYLVKL